MKGLTPVHALKVRLLMFQYKYTFDFSVYNIVSFWTLTQLEKMFVYRKKVNVGENNLFRKRQIMP